MIFNETFEKILVEAEKLRLGYRSSLGKGNLALVNEFESILESKLPEVFRVIYSTVKGTDISIKNQVYFDFIPGYRLVDVTDILLKSEKYILKSDEGYTITLFENYSSDYIVAKYDLDMNCKGIFREMHDELESEIICLSDYEFFEMMLEFYQEAVFFLDSDGYIDSDFDKEGEVGQRLNPNIAYWA